MSMSFYQSNSAYPDDLYDDEDDYTLYGLDDENFEDDEDTEDDDEE